MTSAGEPEYTRDELIAELGISTEYAEKMWNAFGFARQNTDEKVFTAAEVEALRFFAHSDETIPQAAQVPVARAIGQTMSRLADWQAEQLIEFDKNPEIPWTRDQMALALGLIQQMIWRRHLSAALERDIAHPHDESQELVVGFVDIVGYTSLSRRIGMAELEILLEIFEDQTHEIIAKSGGTVIKTLGDAVMFTFTEASGAAEAALAIHRLSEDDRIPSLRVGLARGHILTRLGDVFGEPVNIAARLCGSARPGTTLVDQAVADELADTPSVHLRPIPTLSVRGYRRLKARVLTANRYNRSDSAGSENTDAGPTVP
ncbi:adenylate/guanylate cyclase domain-containing protein [Gordonia desulfuricans]|uniref:Adenylate/guanylate cyclase domain-containing protein n=1 Tax=Gordonia desulfuricans TaxID=89051 RepID=A0A7K3LKU7_9ACTN|nr:adenylate/guanylate cyclase domain-containing protein [Gordonia desulfuricans]NDK88882.1 adenylate/guanylate cyclase domain-containing protein [Gordonia desulfuricans]